MSEKDFQRKKNKFLPKIHAWYYFLKSIFCKVYYFLKNIFFKVLDFVIQVIKNPRFASRATSSLNET